MESHELFIQSDNECQSTSGFVTNRDLATNFGYHRAAFHSLARAK